MSIIEDTIARWRFAGVEVQPAASAEDIRAIEELLGTPLPADVRAFYQCSDGMRDFAHDRFLLSMWSSKRMVREFLVDQYNR